MAISLSLVLLSGNASEPASEQESQTEKLARETQNPIANLISVPFWLAASNDRWTVPIGGGVGKLFKLGKLPVNTKVGWTEKRRGQSTQAGGPRKQGRSFWDVEL